MKVLAILYPGVAASPETPELLRCAENVLGCAVWSRREAMSSSP